MPQLSTRKILAGAALTAAALAPLAVTTSAEAAFANLDGRHTVCADSLTLRETPGGAVVATIHNGATFDIYRGNGGNTWVRGDALEYYNGVRRSYYGYYVVNGYFC